MRTISSFLSFYLTLLNSYYAHDQQFPFLLSHAALVTRLIGNRCPFFLRLVGCLVEIKSGQPNRRTDQAKQYATDEATILPNT
jgi:hypothetical protein